MLGERGLLDVLNKIVPEINIEQLRVRRETVVSEITDSAEGRVEYLSMEREKKRKRDYFLLIDSSSLIAICFHESDVLYILQRIDRMVKKITRLRVIVNIRHDSYLRLMAEIQDTMTEYKIQRL